MKTSETQARQIHLSIFVTDSVGNAETSSGWILPAALGFPIAALVAGDFFRTAGFAALGGRVEGFGRTAAFLAGRFGMPQSSLA
jgi:hypothetical protein